MTFTGFDWVVLSNTAPADVRRLFAARLNALWSFPMVEEFDGSAAHFELFFSKDKAMNEFHEKNGFSLNDDGQGCFMLCGRKFDLFHGVANIHDVKEPRILAGIEPYFSGLLFKNIWEYTVVLPDDPDENPFSRKIVSMLEASLLVCPVDGI